MSTFSKLNEGDELMIFGRTRGRIHNRKQRYLCKVCGRQCCVSTRMNVTHEHLTKLLMEVSTRSGFLSPAIFTSVSLYFRRALFLRPEGPLRAGD
jgi:hypothetical protein